MNQNKYLKISFLFLIISLSQHTTTAQEVRDTIITQSNWQYHGEWPNGSGVLYDDYNGLYIGSFQQGIPSGICVQFTPFGNYYGTFADGKRNGKGIICYDNGDVLESTFQDGEPHGSTRYFYKTDSLFLGVYVNGKKKDGKMIYGTIEGIEAIKPKLPTVYMEDAQIQYVQKLYEIAEETSSAPLFRGKDLNSFSKWVNSQLSKRVNSRIKRDITMQDSRSTRLIASFTIDPLGNITDVKILRHSLSKEFDETVTKIILSSSGEWSPKYIWNKAVSSSYSFPVILTF